MAALCKRCGGENGDFDTTDDPCICAPHQARAVLWHVAWRWVLHYGTPEKIIIVRSIGGSRGGTAEGCDPAHVFESRLDAVTKADSYQYQRDNGTEVILGGKMGWLIPKSDPRFVYPPDMRS